MGVGEVIGWTVLGAVIGAATVASCGALGAAVGTTCAGWSVSAAAMPTVIGGSAATGAGVGGTLGYNLAKDEEKERKEKKK